MRFTARYPSPVDGLLLASDGELLTGLWLDGQKHYAAGLSPDAVPSDHLPVFQKTKHWLDDYFAGRRPQPSALPLTLSGSEYRRRIWALLLDIPYGETTSYGQLAKEYEVRYGVKTAARAVGGAVGRNPVSIIVPCHRVVGVGGALTGYAGGTDAKRFLLELEKKHLL